MRGCLQRCVGDGYVDCVEDGECCQFELVDGCERLDCECARRVQELSADDAGEAMQSRQQIGR